MLTGFHEIISLILLVARPEYVGETRSIPLLLMSCIRVSPNHHQLWYCPYEIIRIHYTSINRYLRHMGDKTIPDEASFSLDSFYSHISGRYIFTTIKVWQILCLLHEWKVVLTVKTPRHRQFAGCLTVVIYTFARAVSVTTCNCKIIHTNYPNSSKNIQIYQIQFCRCRSAISWCHWFQDA